jgi:NitT/TauT family transport system permease protein
MDRIAAISKEATRTSNRLLTLEGKERRRGQFVGLASVVIGLGLWEIAGQLMPSSWRLFFVPLSEVFVRLGVLLQSGELIYHFRISGTEFILGFLLATVVGILTGMLMGASNGVRHLLDPWVMGLFSTPTVALAPLFIMIFGLGLSSKVAVTFLLAVLPIIISTCAGVRSTPRDLIEVGRAFGCSRLKIFAKVLAPAALPFVVAGLRQGIGRGIVGVVVGELLGSKAGLGFMIQQSYQLFDAATVYGGILLLAATGILASGLVQAVENRMAPWRSTSLTL